MIMLLFILGAVGMRFLPHVWNFTPIVAMLLLSGAYMKRQWLWAPVVALMASDFALNIWVYHTSGHADQYFTWGAWLAVLLLAQVTLSGRLRLPVLAGTTVASSTLFFAISNFGVWAAGGLYAHTWAGLAQCFWLAIPFYRSALLGDLLYTAVFFGLYALITQRQVARAAA